LNSVGLSLPNKAVLDMSIHPRFCFSIQFKSRI
jgi:hypothetical protein